MSLMGNTSMQTYATFRKGVGDCQTDIPFHATFLFVIRRVGLRIPAERIGMLALKAAIRHWRCNRYTWLLSHWWRAARELPFRSVEESASNGTSH